MRQLPDREFDAILRAGFAGEDMPLPEPSRQPGMPAGFDEPQADFERPIVESVVARPFRDQAFTRQVRAAYDNRCAVTGLRLINGGGRPDVQAAHRDASKCAIAFASSWKMGSVMSTAMGTSYDRECAINCELLILPAFGFALMLRCQDEALTFASILPFACIGSGLAGTVAFAGIDAGAVDLM